MNFIFIEPRYHTNQRDWVKALIRAGHSTSFFALYKTHSEDYSEITPVIMPYWILSWRCFSQKKKKDNNPIDYVRNNAIPLPVFLYSKLKQYQPDVVIIKNLFKPYGAISFLICKLMRKKIIIYTQTPKFRQENWQKRFVKFIAAILLNSAWITPVKGDENDFPASGKHICYIPFAADNKPKKDGWFKNDKINILCIGKFVSRKNHILMLEAIDRIRRKYPVTLTIIGQCTTDDHKKYFRQVIDLVNEKGMTDCVRVKTNIPFSQMEKAYVDHDLFVLPSRNENAAVSVLEAMSFGLPVISSDSGGERCYVEPGVNGYLFKTDDLRDLEDKICRVVMDRNHLVSMGNYSIELVRNKYSHEKFCMNMARILKNSFGLDMNAELT